jgi:hypothetical protein
MLKSLALAALFVAALGGNPALACSVPLIRTFVNQTVTGYMAAKSGRPCSIHFVSSSGPMSSVKVVQGPSNGTLRLNERMGLRYQSQPSFVGRDSFTYARHGLDTRNNPAVRTVKVEVTVTP